MTILLKAICRFSMIDRATNGILHRTKTNNFKFCMETQKSPNSQSNLKKNGVGGINFLTSDHIIKLEAKTLWYWLKTAMGPMCSIGLYLIKIESPKINPHPPVDTFNKGKKYTPEKDSLFNK